MGCSNARLLVQAPLTGEPGAGTINPLSPSSSSAAAPVATSPVNVTTDTNNSTTRMHLTGVDLVVERNGSYTLLLTPKTHKQLMPYVLRKKRFRILVDKPRSDPILNSNEPILMENNKESSKKTQKKMESTIESIEQMASDEYEKVKNRFVGGRSIDRGNPEDEDEYIQSDDEGMIEEIVTTVEQDKDLECKIKKKIETKKTTAQHPETHNTITKVVKTEVTEITRTITINDHHDLERAKRELGIDDVNRLLPSSSSSSSWINQSRLIQKSYEPINEIVTSKDFQLDSPIKQSYHPNEKPILAESTIVGRGPVIETMPSSESKPIEIKTKKKQKKIKSKFCSCTRAVDDDEQDKQKVIITPIEQPKKSSPIVTPIIIQSTIDTQIQGQQLISSDLKQLIIDKKHLLIEYIHSKIFSPSNLFTSNDDDIKARKISSRILDLLRYDRCLSWIQMYEQLQDEYIGNLLANQVLQPMINTYENLFTTKQANLLNTFATIHNENDLTNIQENTDYLNIAQIHIHQSNIDIIIPKQSVDNIEQLDKEQIEILPEQVIKIDDEQQPIKELNMSDDNNQESQSIYNEEYLIKMLADISQHKPITLAEAIAYQHLDIEDPKLGLSNETIQSIKNLFRPLTDQTLSNFIRIKRSGEYLTDINLTETNPFEKLTLSEPLIYQLQQTFEPTLDFSEKQFRLLTEIITNNKEQYNKLEFDIARTSLPPIYDLKELSINDFSQSDSGYSMTTATHESLASKIKIEFEPINQDINLISSKYDADDDDNEKIDLDKATKEQLDKYELNHDLIQIIKSDFNGMDKTIGQAILSRELRLDSTDPSDISHLNSLGIHKEQIRILTAFFFPKHTRIIAYSPEPGRFVEAQTTFNPEYPGYKTDTTIIQIQEKQLSSDQLAMKRNIHDDRTIQHEQILPIVITPTPPIAKTPSPPPIELKKRKSNSTGGLLSCFKSKKPKSGTEQQGQPTILVTQTSTTQEIIKPIDEKPTIDYSILPDGKRIYIDVFRNRPGFDMSYKPNDFENRFVLPISKPASEYERPITPEHEPQILEHKSVIHSESQTSTIEHKPHIHLEPRPAIIEPVDVQPDSTSPIIFPLRKSEDKTVTKKLITINLHGPAVDLPEIELVTPGPLPTLSINTEKTTKKIKKSTGNLCSSCFGVKSAAKKKNEIASESVQAPIEQQKSIEKGEEEKEAEEKDPTPIVEVSTLSSTKTDEPILPRVNIDIFRERNFDKTTETLPKPEDRLATIVEKTIPVIEPHYQSSPSNESVPQNTSIFSQVNIDTFKERTFQKNSENKFQDTINETVTSSELLSTLEQPLYQLPTNEPIPSSVQSISKDTSIFSQVNIDTFKERTFQKSSENLPKSQEQLNITNETEPEESHYQLPTNEPVSSVQATKKDTSIFSQVNIDTFKERTFEKSSENLPKSEEYSDTTNEIITPLSSEEEPHYQLPTNEPVTPPFPTSQSIDRITNDSSVYSQVNIDIFKERTFPKHSENFPKSEEPHYELPLSEPVPLVSENEYSTTELNTYDIPRKIEVEQTSSSSPPPSIEIKTEEKNEIMTLSTATTDIQISTEPIKEVKQKKIKTKKLKQPKIKSNIFSKFFRHNKHKSNVPALDLPAVERDLSPNNQPRQSHRRDSDPLHIPSIDLPKLNLPLPDYDRPEVNMTTGHHQQLSEFNVPVIDYPPIPNLQLPSDELIQNFNSDHMKVPHIQLPDLQFTLIKHEKLNSIQPTIEKGLTLSSPVDDMLSIQTDHKNFPIETDYAIQTETIITTLTSNQTLDQQVTIIDTHLVQIPLSIENQTSTSDLGFQLPSSEPVLTLTKDSKLISPPSFDDDVPSPPSKIVSTSEKQPIEIKSEIKKKSSTLSFCSCFGNKSTITKEKLIPILTAPKANLPEIEMPLPSSNISSTLKPKGPLRAPNNNLPQIDLTPTSMETIHLPSIHIQEKKIQTSNETEAIVPSIETNTPQIQSDISSLSTSEKQPIETVSTEPKKSSSSTFEIKIPTMDIPPVDLSGPVKSEAYLSFSKQEESIQSRSDSGLEAIISSHVHPSSTFADIQQLPSVSSGFGSEILDNMTAKGYSLPDIELPEPILVPKKQNSTDYIYLNDDGHKTLILHENQLKILLETEISKSIDDLNSKKDKKSLNKILTHAIDLIKTKQILTYSELKQKLTIEHKNEAFLIEPIVHSLYYTFENYGLDNLDKPEFPLGIHDMLRLPAKQTYDTVTQLNKESAPLSATSMTKEILPETARSCLTCGRSKSKINLPITTISSSSLLDERHRLQLNTHRNELINILREHIQSSKPPIRQFNEHSKDIDKILRKALTILSQTKTTSYEQIRNELKIEYKQTYYLIDPIVDIIRDTFDHCDISQMNEKINLDILDSNISQTSYLYNNQDNLLTIEESNALKSNQLSWLQSYLINNEIKEKKLTRKQINQLNKILHRILEILSMNLITTWDELNLQLQREYSKAQDLCNRSIELIKQSQKNGLFHLQQAPIQQQDKRRPSSLITEHARQNIKTNRNQIILSLKNFLIKHNQLLEKDEQLIMNYLNKIFSYLEEHKLGQFKTYQDLKEQLKKDFKKSNQDKLIEQIVDIIEQAHATNQFDDIDKPEVQTLMKDRLDGKPLIIKEMYVSLPSRVGAYGDDPLHYSSLTTNGDRITTSHRVARGLSWREANERARILFYRGKHPAIHYDEQAAAFDVRMLLETASGGTQEIPVTDSDVHELLNSCGVQWDGVNIISLVDHSEDVVRAAEQAALKVIREKGIVDVRPPPPPPPTTTTTSNNDETTNLSTPSSS